MVQLYLENGVAGFPVYLQCSDMSDLSSQLVILQSSKKMKLLQLVEITKDIIVGLNAAFLNEHGSYGIETFRPPVNKDMTLSKVVFNFSVFFLKFPQTKI